MGLLDDAIREHLDLKRRRGADPAEIERLEREALGPVRREPSAFAAGAAGDAHSTALADDDRASSVDAPTEYIDLEAPYAGEPRAAGPDTDDFVVGDEAPSARAAGFAAPDYNDPEFEAFAPAEPPPTGGIDLEPTGSMYLEDDAQHDRPSEPRHKRRGLFGRFSHHDEIEDGPSSVPELSIEDDPFSDHFSDEAASEVRSAAAPSDPVADDPQTAFDRAPADTDPEASASSGSPADENPADSAPPSLRIAPEADLAHTVEYDVERHFREEDAAAGPGPEPEDIFPEEAEAPEEGEDLLEETPDFLADTPDHDRLWFEQKPPPDFHFEG